MADLDPMRFYEERLYDKPSRSKPLRKLKRGFKHKLTRSDKLLRRLYDRKCLTHPTPAEAKQKEALWKSLSLI